MAYPFGGHPTLQRFIELAQEAGCEVTVDVRQTAAGRAYEATHIKNPHGGRLVIPDADLDEHLTPTVVSNYQRRLGIKLSLSASHDPDEASD